MANCSDNTYRLKFTDASKATVTVPKSALITDEYDIALVGKTRLEYGEIFNENVLHILENFACPQDGVTDDEPDVTVAFGNLLENAIAGQIWYNNTQERPYIYDGTNWIPQGLQDDVAGNSGVIADGQLLPQPVNSQGYVFPYDECTWIVTPFAYTDEIDYMECYTNTNGVVTMKYIISGNTHTTSGLANYQIVGIRENVSIGVPPEPLTYVMQITPNPHLNQNITITVTFSEAVADFTVSDVDVTNGTDVSFTAISPTVYEIVKSPTVNDVDMVVSMDPNVAHASSGSGNQAISLTVVDSGPPAF